MRKTAQYLASKGRHGDSMLVHMAPEEVRGLQALAMAHGGSLSINPHTGLVEANFLKKLLPTLIGAGLSFIPGVGPMMAAGIVGGVEGVRTGDLGKGIMAGLGAFGGASMAGSLFGSAASTAAPAATTGAIGAPGAIGGVGGGASGISATAGGAGSNLFSAAPAGASGISGGASALGSTSPFASAAAPQSLSAVSSAAPSAAAPFAGAANIPSTVTAQTPSLLDKAGGLFDKAGTKYMEMFDKSPISTGLMTIGGISALMPQKKPKGPDVEGYYSDFEKRFGYDPRSHNYPIPGAADGGQLDTDPGLNGYAKGGIPIKDGSFIMPARETAEFGNGSSNAGLAALSRLGARPIQGPGDGVSDSIRANIGGRQEARVARDEAYFPPEAVARIGGGNHKKGTKKLYAMMKAAQEARKKADRGQDTGLRGLLA